MSNPEIAERLGISLEGAKYHVSEILSKLGVTSREEAARWQAEERRPWWALAATPLLFWRRLSVPWLLPAVAGTLAIAVAVGVGLLVWALVATRGDGGAALALPAGDRLAYVGADGNLWLFEGGGPAHRITTTDDMAEGGAAWSPDGRYLLFQRWPRVPANSTAVVMVTLWLYDTQTDGLREFRFTQSPRSFPAAAPPVSSALWAPDSRRVAFIAANALWTADLGGNAHQVIDAAFGAEGFAWSPDGTQLAVDRGLSVRYPPDWSVPGAHAEVPQENGLYVINASGGEPRPVALVPAIQQAYQQGEAAAGIEHGLAPLGVIGVDGLQWSPDGTYVSFQAPVLSVAASADGEALFTVPSAGGTPLYHGAMLVSPALLDWFPASHRFVFTLGSGRDTTLDKRLGVADASTAGAQVIAEELERAPTPEHPAVTPPSVSVRADSWPAVSPDGGRIAFQASEASVTTEPRLDIGKIEGPREGIWVANADGSDLGQLTSDPRYLDFFPRWSADGNAILFVRTNGQRYVNEMGTPEPQAHAELWIMRSDGSGARPLISDLQRIGSYYGLFGWEQDIAWYRASK